MPELSMAFPQGAPVVHLIRSPVVLQEKEAVHLMPDEDTNMPEGVTLEVSTATPIKPDFKPDAKQSQSNNLL